MGEWEVVGGLVAGKNPSLITTCSKLIRILQEHCIARSSRWRERVADGLGVKAFA